MRFQLLFATLYATVCCSTALYTCSTNNNISYTNGQSVTIPSTTEDNHIGPGLNCSWTIFIPDDKYVDLVLSANFALTSEQMEDQQFMITSDYAGFRSLYGSTISAHLQILPSTSSIVLTSTASGSFRFTVNWMTKNPPYSQPTTISKNSYFVFDMKQLVKGFVYNAQTIRAAETGMRISLSTSVVYADIAKNVWVYDGGSTTGTRLGTLYDAAFKTLSSTQSMLTLYYACDMDLPSTYYIAADKSAIDQFSHFSLKADPNNVHGLETLYLNNGETKPAAFAYYQPDDSQMTLSKLSYLTQDQSGTIRVYQGIPIGNAAPMAVYRSQDAVQQLPQLFPSGQLLTVTLGDIGMVSVRMFPDTDPPNPNDNSSIVLQPFLVRDQREGHVYSRYYGSQTFQQGISTTFNQMPGKSDLYTFTYSIPYADFSTTTTCIVLTDIDSVKYSYGTAVPTDELKIVGRMFGVNYTSSDILNRGMDLKYRMSLGGDPGNKTLTTTTRTTTRRYETTTSVAMSFELISFASILVTLTFSSVHF